MKIKHYPPSGILQRFVKRFMIIKSNTGMQNQLLPGTSIVMAFRIRGETFFQKDGIENRLAGSAIAGLYKTPRSISYLKKSAALLVFFKEGKAGPFFKFPLHELFELHTSLDCLISRSVLDEIEEQLWHAANDKQRISIVEKFLIQQVRDTEIDRLVHQALTKIKSANGNLRIKNLLADLPISRDSFEKRFRRATGTSPKQFANIIRLRNVINTYSPDKSLTETAYAAGYFDQAHFIKDFKSFTGCTPTVFFESFSTRQNQ